jgi:hypothetical protein
LVVVCRQRYCRPRDLLQRYDSKWVGLGGWVQTKSVSVLQTTEQITEHIYLV